MDLYATFYMPLKALHLIAMVTWFAGLFYLPRLFVYHVKAPKAARPMLATMERKLFSYIMQPSLVVVWLAGLGLLYLDPSWLQQGWLHAKLTLLVILTGYHITLGRTVKVFAREGNSLSERFYRIYNEVPSVILIAVILLAVFKPF